MGTTARSSRVSNSDDVVDRIESATLSGGNSNITFGSSELSDFYNNSTQNNKTKFPDGILVVSNDDNVDWQLLRDNNNGTKSLTGTWDEKDTQRARANESAILKTTPNQNVAQIDSWKCDNSFTCSVARGGWEGYGDGAKYGDYTDVYLNQYDILKNIGKIIGIPYGMIKGGYEYNQRQKGGN